MYSVGIRRGEHQRHRDQARLGNAGSTDRSERPRSRPPALLRKRAGPGPEQLRHEQRGHRLVERRAVVVEVGADQGAEARRLLAQPDARSAGTRT